jgi:hypothetical protein
MGNLKILLVEVCSREGGEGGGGGGGVPKAPVFTKKNN